MMLRLHAQLLHFLQAVASQILRQQYMNSFHIIDPVATMYSSYLPIIHACKCIKQYYTYI